MNEVKQAAPDLLKIFADTGENQNLTQAIADLFPAILWLYDAETQTSKFLNQKITEQLGFSSTDLKAINGDLLNLVNLEDRNRVANALADLVKRQQTQAFPLTCRLKNKTKDDVIYRIETAGVPSYQGNNRPAYLFAAFPAPAHATTNHQPLSPTGKNLVIENEKQLKFGTSIYDFATNTYTWSPGMYALFNCDDQPPNQQITEKFYNQCLGEVAYTQLNELRSHLINSVTQEAKWQTDIVTPDHGLKTIETFCRIYRNEQHTPMYLVETCRDITRLVNYKKTLEEKVAALDNSNKELEEFAYVASHDLQEPLRKLTTFSERLKEKFSDHLPEDGQDYLNRMLKVTNNMRHLISNLLEFSLIARSKAVFEKTNLNKLLAQVTGDLEITIEETGTRIIADPLPELHVIPSQICQLLTNLIGNAIKFRKKDHQPVIQIKYRMLSVFEKAQMLFKKPTTYYCFTITDNGIGFDETYAKLIFEIFQRLHGKAEYPGTGIGLSICKKIVENHGGQIYAQGIPDQGATFTFILPDNQ